MPTYRVLYDTLPSFPVVNPPSQVLGEDYNEVAIVDSQSLETLFREMNVVDGTELPVQLGIRSLSVGDVVEDTEAGQHWFCAPVGWVPVALV